jgi:hypothetical protein
MLAYLFALSFSRVYLHSHDERSFISYLRDHGLMFTGPEYSLRLGIFLSASRIIREHNSGPNSFRLSHNSISIYTPAEYRSLLNSKPRLLPRSSRYRSPADPPDSFDWRLEGAVTPIRTEQNCPGSWAYSAVAAQESQWFITSGSLIVLSEHDLAAFVNPSDPCRENAPAAAYDAVIAGGGSWPGESSEKLTSYLSIPFGDEQSLLNAVYSNGPAAVLIDGSHVSFQLYKSGVYDEPQCSDGILDIAVAVVGYGLDEATPFWIVRNAWGASWGEGGYIRMSRNKGNQCGIASMAIVPSDK